jgi:inositol 3-alpha-galactosyltransferase
VVDFFDDESLDYKGVLVVVGGDSEEEAVDHVRLSLRQALAQAGAVKYFPAPSTA